MTIFGSPDVNEPELSEYELSGRLLRAKRAAKRRRLLLVAPATLVVAVAGAVIAAPPSDLDLNLIADAEASAEQDLPWVFGADGVWSFAEPIANAPSLNPADQVADHSRVLADRDPINFTLDGVPAAASVGEDHSTSSFPVSVPSPPTPTPGQFAPQDGDWSSYSPEIRILPTPAPAVVEEAILSAPVSPADTTIKPDAEPNVPGGDAADQAAADTYELPGANPSTPPATPTDDGSLDVGQHPEIEIESVLVHSAHVSLRVRIVDGDSGVIDWCNTWVDWGDGTTTQVANTDGAAICAAACEQAAAPSDGGVDATVTFEHSYAAPIDAAPIVNASTGDDCRYQSSVIQLPSFTVWPY